MRVDTDPRRSATAAGASGRIGECVRPGSRVWLRGHASAALRYTGVLLVGVVIGGAGLVRLDAPSSSPAPDVSAPAAVLAAAPDPVLSSPEEPAPLWVSSPDSLLNSLQIEDAGTYISGLASVKIDGRWGYLDRTGRLLIPPRFDEAGWFSQGAAAVKVGDKWGYIDQTGRLFIEPQFDQASSFSRGLAPVRVGDKWGYVDRTGRMIIQPRFESAYSFWDSITAARLDGRWVFIDVTGRIILDPEAHTAPTTS